MKEGKVYIVGAGPGDEKLISVRAMELIGEADVILYDRLGAKGFIQFAKETCEKIDAGKQPNNHTLHQYEINQLLVEKAKEGKKVLRLKGGDPFLFGRGGEEAEALFAEGVPFEVVPGISSFYSACTYAGIPVTHRDFAASFHVFTGHRKKDTEMDFETMGKLEGTLIFLMGMKHLEGICKGLMENGKPKHTPTAIVQWGTTSRQRSVIGKLSNICELAEREGIGHPAVIVVGDVVQAQERIAWQKYRPLWGRRILLNGVGESLRETKEMLQEEGAEVVAFPTISIEKPDSFVAFDQALAELPSYTWLFFTSVRAVESFFERMKEQKIDVRSLQGIKIFCIGEKTKEAVEERGMFVDRVPQHFNSVQGAEELAEFISEKDCILFPASELASDTLEDKAKELGATFQRVTAYSNRFPKNESVLKEFMEEPFDAIGFFSSSQVVNFLKMTDDKMEGVKLCSIGPMTSDCIRQAGFEVFTEATVSTGMGLAKAIKDCFR